MMRFLEEHNYGSAPQIKPEIDKHSLEIQEINIKSEFDSNSNDADSFLQDASCSNEETDQIESEADSQPVKINTQPTRKILKAGSDSEDERKVSRKDVSLSDLQKACILQSCLTLLDSSSSDDDELMLLWLLCRNRRKKLRKRRRI